MRCFSERFDNTFKVGDEVYIDKGSSLPRIIGKIIDIDGDAITISDGKFTYHPNISKVHLLNLESKRVVEYVRPEVDKAWNLLDAWFEREWGEIPYNESAKSILVTESYYDYVDEASGDYLEGTCAVVFDLINCIAYYDAYDEDGEDLFGFTEKYANIDEMVRKLIQPMADGSITEEDLLNKFY